MPCVWACDPVAVEMEMRERGVRPDLLRGDARAGSHAPLEQPMKWMTWTVDSAPAQWLPKIDTIAIKSLPEEAWQARRWLRLAPRYLGRLGEGFRVLHCDEEDAIRIADGISRATESGEIGLAVKTQIRNDAD